MVSDAIVIGGLSINTAFLLGIVYQAGKIVQRLENVEKRSEVVDPGVLALRVDAVERRTTTMENLKAEVFMATVTTDLKHLGDTVRVIQRELRLIAKSLIEGDTELALGQGD